MPYGKYRRNYRRPAGSRARKPTAVMVKKTKKVPLVTAHRFAKLEKRVSMNTAKAYGPVQSNWQLWNSSVPCAAASPILFDASDFTAWQSDTAATVSIGAKIFSWAPTAVPPAVTTPSYWTREDFVGNPYWRSQNQDVPNGGMYKPISSKITLRISGVPTISNCRVRVDHFRTKRGRTHPANLIGFDFFPDAIKHHLNMATPTLNKFSPTYIQLVKTKWVTLNSSHYEGEGAPGEDPEKAPPQGTTVNFKYVTIHLNRKKPVRQIIGRPTISPLIDNDGEFVAAQAELAHGNYGPNNRAPSDIDWIMISCSDTAATELQSVSVIGARFNRWRDRQGNSQIL